MHPQIDRLGPDRKKIRLFHKRDLDNGTPGSFRFAGGGRREKGRGGMVNTGSGRPESAR